MSASTVNEPRIRGLLIVKTRDCKEMLLLGFGICCLCLLRAFFLKFAYFGDMACLLATSTNSIRPPPTVFFKMSGLLAVLTRRITFLI
ncbi:hypothetical protein Syun_006686 [Stephania yunnanensis]|uniref:Uncharacterized protein n=1 Tax=Stephania yunnanensis TaxID=152371 RepID=A0AAP0PYR2_9MAGN